jgi:pSer/pThr/pTyr-binding forkhead associated (FHA) protein
MSVLQADLCRRAFGAAGAMELEILQPGHRAERRAFERPFVLLGRYSDNDICLKTDLVSRRHAYLQLVAGRVFFIDLGSRQGICYQGEPCKQGWLQAGEGLQIGTTIVRVPPRRSQPRPPPAAPSLDWNPTASLPPSRYPIPAVTLEISHRASRPVRWRMNRFLALAGGAAACKVRLIAPGVSQYHCSFVHTPVGLWVVDLLSREGLVLNDQPVRWARLADGDRLQLGSFLVRPWYDDPLPGADDPQALASPSGGWGDCRNGHVVPAGAADGVPWSPSVLVQVLEQVNAMQQQMVEHFHQSMRLMVDMFTALHREEMGVVRQELHRLQQLTAELQSLHAELGNNGAGSPAVRPGAPPVQPVARAPVGDPSHARAAGPAAAPAPPAADARIHAWLGERIAALNAERQGRWEKLMGFLKGG